VDEANVWIKMLKFFYSFLKRSKDNIKGNALDFPTIQSSFIRKASTLTPNPFVLSRTGA
jgi:hypothetical protein